MTSIGTVGSYTKVYSCTYYSTVQFDKVKFNNRPNSVSDQTGDTDYSAATTNTSIYTYSSIDAAGDVNNITTQILALTEVMRQLCASGGQVYFEGRKNGV